MVISSVSEEKAKYKSMMVNWVAALCLVFFLHYIMSGIMFITEKAVEIIGNGLSGSSYEIYRPGTDTVENFKIKTPARVGGNIGAQDYDDSKKPDAKVYNLMELTRVYVNLDDQGLAFAYLLVYLVLVVYTIIFIFKYLKRFMYMAFLTLIAPVIAFTYPIDKIKDGSAQAFNKWLTEYLFNALLQPLHLLIYVVLIGTATDLVKVNFIYAIVALAFINQAEKILREFFGLNKATTTGGSGAFAKGALASQMLSRVKSAGGAAKSLGSKGSGGSGGSGKSSVKPRQAKGLEAYVGANGSGKNGYIPSDKKQELGESSSGPSKTLSKERQEELEAKYNSSNNSTFADGATGENAKGVQSANTDKPQISSGKKNDKKEAKELKRAEKQQKKKLKLGNNKKTRRGAIAGMTAGMAKNAASKAIKYTGKKLGKGAIRTLAAVPGAFLGGAMSIATGNTTYLAAGAGAGALLGGKAADALGRAPKGIRSAYRKERLGTQGAAGRERYDEFMKDKNNINYFKEEYGLSTDEAKERIKQGRDFIEAGYTNPEDIGKLTDLQKEFGGEATNDQIMAAYQMASSYGADYFMDDKKLANLEDNSTHKIMAEASKSGQSMDEATARKMAQKHINVMASSKGLSAINFEENKAKVEAAKQQEQADKELDRQFKQAMINQAKVAETSQTRRTETSGARTSTTRESGTRTSSARSSSTRASSARTSTRRTSGKTSGTGKRNNGSSNRKNG